MSSNKHGGKGSMAIIGLKFLVVYLVLTAPNMVSVKAAIPPGNWHQTVYGGDIGIGVVTGLDFAGAESECDAEGGVVYTYDFQDKDLLMTHMNPTGSYWVPTNFSTGCGLLRPSVPSTFTALGPTPTVCTINLFAALCYRPPACNAIPRVCSITQGSCSKDCGVGTVTSSDVTVSCNGGAITFVCPPTMDCCCHPCGGTGSGRPPVKFCNDPGVIQTPDCNQP